MLKRLSNLQVLKKSAAKISIVVIFAAFGAIAISKSFAATFVVASESENGSVSGASNTTNDALASGGKAVTFGDQTTTPPSSTNGYVSRSGSQLILNGKPFKFVGFNLFDAAATDFYKCGGWARYSDSELDSALGYMHDQAGVRVLRVWMYQTYTKSGTDWTGTDKIINLAKKHDIKLIAALEDGPGYCTTGSSGAAKWQYQGDTYYTAGYKSLYGSAAKSYREYAPLVAAHYKNEPTIMAWDLINEPDTSAKNAAGKSVLVDFVADMGALIKAADPNHLLSYGGQSNGVSGATGADYISVNSSPYIDFGEIHNYHYQDSDSNPLPGSSDGHTLPNPNSSQCLVQYQPNNMIACSIAQAIQVVRKPVIIGESGIAASDDASRQSRAQYFDAKMKASFDNGVSGYLVWQFNKVVDSEQFDVLQSTSDPLIAVMKRYAN